MDIETALNTQEGMLEGIVASQEVKQSLIDNTDFAGSFCKAAINVVNFNQTYTDRYGMRVNYAVCDLSDVKKHFDKVYILDNELKKITKNELGFIRVLTDYSESVVIQFAKQLEINLNQDDMTVMKLNAVKKLVIFTR